MSVNTVQTYLSRITSEHQDKAKFMATVALSVAIFVRLQEIFDRLETTAFDLDTPPVGEQLDFVGEWAGLSREVAEPVSGVYFSWDDVAGDGWDSGVWQPPNQPAQLVSLPDDVYLIVMRAKIAANNWDGTTAGAYAVWAILFPVLSLLIQDFQDMSITIALTGAPVDALTQALLTQGYLPLRPEGVRVREYIVSVDSAPLFSWDVSTPNMDGWDIGSWGEVL